MRYSLLVLAALASLTISPALNAQAMVSGDRIATDNGDLIIEPISHATFAMGWDGRTIYVDPVGGAEAFQDLPGPDLILITDIHGDHLNVETLEAVADENTVIVAPAAVVEQLPEALESQARTLDNGSEMSLFDLTVLAIPMYNLTGDRLQYHDNGRGNGYVVTLGGQHVYISGDTEDIPEMRALENIDVAFICFNLPYTMTEEQAASAYSNSRLASSIPTTIRAAMWTRSPPLSLRTKALRSGSERGIRQVRVRDGHGNGLRLANPNRPQLLRGSCGRWCRTRSSQRLEGF